MRRRGGVTGARAFTRILSSERGSERPQSRRDACTRGRSRGAFCRPVAELFITVD